MKSKHALRNLILIVAVVAVSAVVLAGCGKKNDGRKVSLIECDGGVTIERGKKTINGECDMELRSGDVIVTGENGSARVRIDDDKFLYLGASSRVRLTAKGTADKSKTTVYVEKGALMTEVKRKLNDASTFDVVTRNSAMEIRGTKTITEVYEDILGAIKTNAAVVEGQVSFHTIQIDLHGKITITAVSVDVDHGVAVITPSNKLVAEKDAERMAERTAAENVEAIENTSYEEQGVKLERPAFSENFLTNCVAVLARSREEDVEEGFAAEDVTEEELNAAINILNDVIDGKIVLPAAVEEYILNHTQPYYDDPIVPDEQMTEPETEPADVDTKEAEESTTEPETKDSSNEDLPADGKHIHNLVSHDGLAATCTSAGYEPYDTCSGCGYTTFTEIPALGHDFGAWTVTTAPYPVYEGEYVATWHAGEKTRQCSRCTETEKAIVYATPVLKAEIYDTVTTLPVDFFTFFGRNPEAAGKTLQSYGTEFFWVASPSVPGKPYDWVGIDGAVLEWVEGGTVIGSLQAGNTIHMKITVPAELRDVYEDTVVPITLTPAHEHVWGEGYVDPEDPTLMNYDCEICGITKSEPAEVFVVGD